MASSVGGSGWHKEGSRIDKYYFNGYTIIHKQSDFNYLQISIVGQSDIYYHPVESRLKHGV